MTNRQMQRYLNAITTQNKIKNGSIEILKQFKRNKSHQIDFKDDEINILLPDEGVSIGDIVERTLIGLNDGTTQNVDKITNIHRKKRWTEDEQRERSIDDIIPLNAIRKHIKMNKNIWDIDYTINLPLDLTKITIDEQKKRSKDKLISIQKCILFWEKTVNTLETTIHTLYVDDDINKDIQDINISILRRSIVERYRRELQVLKISLNSLQNELKNIANLRSIMQDEQIMDNATADNNEYNDENDNNEYNDENDNSEDKDENDNNNDDNDNENNEDDDDKDMRKIIFLEEEIEQQERQYINMLIEDEYSDKNSTVFQFDDLKKDLIQLFVMIKSCLDKVSEADINSIKNTIIQHDMSMYSSSRKKYIKDKINNTISSRDTTNDNERYIKEINKDKEYWELLYPFTKSEYNIYYSKDIIPNIQRVEGCSGGITWYNTIDGIGNTLDPPGTMLSNIKRQGINTQLISDIDRRIISKSFTYHEKPTDYRQRMKRIAKKRHSMGYIRDIMREVIYEPKPYKGPVVWGVYNSDTSDNNNENYFNFDTTIDR